LKQTLQLLRLERSCIKVDGHHRRTRRQARWKLHLKKSLLVDPARGSVPRARNRCRPTPFCDKYFFSGTVLLGLGLSQEHAAQLGGRPGAPPHVGPSRITSCVRPDRFPRGDDLERSRRIMPPHFGPSATRDQDQR
jgi:hypothetical protein